ncbi:protein containing Metal-dependent phosphohydrolase domain, partial [sediment metagenome]
LKKVIRYGRSRINENDTESVGEHIFGMFILINHFLPLVDPEKKMNKEKIYELALFHDIDEIETGDIIRYEKTDKDRGEAKTTLAKIFQNTPDNFLFLMKNNYFEYEENNTPEAKFVSAIDKIEPMFHLCFDPKGAKSIFSRLNMTVDEIKEDKKESSKDFYQIIEYIEPAFDIIKSNLNK